MECLPLAAAPAQPFHGLGVDDREKPRPFMMEHLVGDGRTHTAKTSEKRPSAPQPPLLGSCRRHRAKPRRIERPESLADIDVREHLIEVRDDRLHGEELRAANPGVKRRDGQQVTYPECVRRVR